MRSGTLICIALLAIAMPRRRCRYSSAALPDLANALLVVISLSWRRTQVLFFSVLNFKPRLAEASIAL